MVYCEECDKKLGIVQRYSHPALGKRFLVCGNCFEKIDKDMERWRTFCLSDSFNVESSRVDIQEAWDKNISNDPPQKKWFSNLWLKIESQPCGA